MYLKLEILKAVKTSAVVLWNVTQCGIVNGTKVSAERAASIFALNVTKTKRQFGRQKSMA
jgi:hypothetical protein